MILRIIARRGKNKAINSFILIIFKSFEYKYYIRKKKEVLEKEKKKKMGEINQINKDLGLDFLPCK